MYFLDMYEYSIEQFTLAILWRFSVWFEVLILKMLTDNLTRVRKNILKGMTEIKNFVICADSKKSNFTFLKKCFSAFIYML